MQYCNWSSYVREGWREGKVQIHSPEFNDPIDAQQVFIDAMLMEHTDRLLEAENEMVELPHAIFDSQKKLLKRIMDKCCPKDVPKGTKIALSWVGFR